MAGKKKKKVARAADVRKAKKLFDRIDSLDGCGIVVTNCDLLAESIAELFLIDPVEVYAEYAEDTEGKT